VASCTPPVLVGEGANQTISGTVMDKAGNGASTAIMHVNVDATAPTINLVNPTNGGSYLLNQSASASYTCADTGSSGLVAGTTGCSGPSASGSQFDTASVGNKSFAVNARDAAGNTASQTASYGVFYSTGACLGDLGHAILQPINASGTMSVFKLGSTVPTKFRVCDANGVSIGAAGVVIGYGLLSAASSPDIMVDEAAYSTTPDTAFRWDPTSQQWIFNQSTKSNGTLNKVGTIYYFGIHLKDESWIYFQYGLK